MAGHSEKPLARKAPMMIFMKLLICGLAQPGSSGGGLAWKSISGFFSGQQDTTRAGEELAHSTGGTSLGMGEACRGKPDGQLERARVLAIGGRPAYVDVADRGQHDARIWQVLAGFPDENAGVDAGGERNGRSNKVI